MSKVVKIESWEAIQSQGVPTVAARMTLDTGVVVETTVASDVKTSMYQTQELRDQDISHYEGHGVTKAVYYINNLIAPKLVGVAPTKQGEVDGWLLAADSTSDRSRLGVNTIHAVSTLFAKAGAKDQNMTLFTYLNSLFNARYAPTNIKVENVPTPIVPVVTRQDTKDSFDFKEFAITPSSSFPFSKALEAAVRIYHTSKKLFKRSTIGTNLDALEVIRETIESVQLRLAVDVFIALNIGASYFGRGSVYNIKDKPQPLKQNDYLEYLAGINRKYSPLFIIDPIVPDDIALWKTLNQTLSKETYLVGADLIFSNGERLKKMVADQVCTSFMLKPPSVGTITEVMDLVAFARKSNVNYIFSTSDQETNDSLVADLAVALDADFVKFGRPLHGENLAKYNRLLEIEREIAKKV